MKLCPPEGSLQTSQDETKTEINTVFVEKFYSYYLICETFVCGKTSCIFVIADLFLPLERPST